LAGNGSFSGGGNGEGGDGGRGGDGGAGGDATSGDGTGGHGGNANDEAVVGSSSFGWEYTLQACADDRGFLCANGGDDVAGDCVGLCEAEFLADDCTGHCIGEVEGDCTGICEGDVLGDCTGFCNPGDGDDDDDDDNGGWVPTGGDDDDSGDDSAEVLSVSALPSTGAGPTSGQDEAWLIAAGSVFMLLGAGYALRKRNAA
jgi:hypothetical protein